MPDCLAYWKSYWNRLKEEDCLPDTREADRIASPVWQTHGKDIMGQVRPGENLWVVVSGDGLGKPEEWRLLQRIYVAERPEVRGEPQRRCLWPVFGEGQPRKERHIPDFATARLCGDLEAPKVR